MDTIADYVSQKDRIKELELLLSKNKCSCHDKKKTLYGNRTKSGIAALALIKSGCPLTLAEISDITSVSMEHIMGLSRSVKREEL
jgi:hypothetical protein